MAIGWSSRCLVQSVDIMVLSFGFGSYCPELQCLCSKATVYHVAFSSVMFLVSSIGLRRMVHDLVFRV